MEVERTDRYDRGMRELLVCLPEDVLKGVLSAATGSLVQYGAVPLDENGQPRTDPRTHAVNSIMMYSDAMSLLNKQRMKKAYLADYLNQKGVKMTIPATKHSLCTDILKYWGREMPENIRVIDDEPIRRENNNASRSRGSEQKHHPPIPLPADSSPSSQNPAFLQNGLPQPQAVIITEPGGSSTVSNGAENSLVPTHEESMEYETAVSLRQKEAHLGQQLGREFSAWFYERLNTLTDFVTTHFWPECNFRLEIVFAAQPDHTMIDETTMNGEECCAKIKDLVAVKQLYFNPNRMGSGIRGYLNPHGLAQVMVCGTIHQKETGAPVGVFEQMFGLMKDPRLGNNYKIKFSVLRLREGNHLAVQGSPPELLDSTLVGIIEEVDDD